MTYRYCPENWSRLSALLDSAPDLPEDQRLSWIEEFATENQEVKAQLRRLLTAAIPADKFLCKRPNFAAVMLDEAACFQQIEIELQPDRLIGAYRLTRELGHGGMGSVWLAQRIDGKFKRDVALKFPFAGPRQRQLVERLIREREILAGLQHANIARLYDADVTASGQPFLVLEYIDGVAINDYCDQHRLNLRARLLLFQQVLSAVRYAHAHLVIHRDLKPSNILITDDGVVHLLDFGIATFIADGAAHTTPLTQFGGRALTPEYASPEQISGSSITTASDVYALGVVLYELLTGSSPYRWQRDQRVQLEEAIANADVISPNRTIISNEIATSRSTKPRQLGKILSGEVNTLLLKALKKNVDERYASADEFYQDIGCYLEHQPIHAQPDSQWYRVRKFARRNRVAVVSFAAIAIALITGTGIALWQAHLAAQQAHIAAQQRDRAVALAARGEAITEFMRLMVTEIADADEPITMQTLLARAEEIANKTFSSNADQHIAILNVLGEYYFDLQEHQLAEQSYSKALALARNMPDQALTGSLMCRIGLAKAALGKIDSARSMVEQGMSKSEHNPEAQAECLDADATLNIVDDDARGAIEELELAQSKLKSSGAPQQLLTISLSVSLASAEEQLGNYVAAIKGYESANAQLEKLGRGEQLLAMTIQSKWANAELYIGNPRLGLEHLDRAQAIAAKRGAKHNEAASYSLFRAGILSSLGQYQQALRSYQSAIDYAESNHNVPVVVEAKQGLMRVLLATNHVGEALQMMQDIRKFAASTKLTTGGIYALHMTLLEGMLDMKQQHYQDAVKKFSTGIEFFESHHQANNSLGFNLGLRGEAYLAMTDLMAARADALRDYNLAHKVQQDVPCSKNTGEAALLLAKVDQRRNDLEAARKWVMIAYQQLQGSVGAGHPDTLEAKHLLDSLQTTH